VVPLISPSPSPFPSLASPSLVFLLLALILTSPFLVIPKFVVSHLITSIAFILVLCFPLKLSSLKAYFIVIRFAILLASFRTFPFLLIALHYLNLLSEAILIFLLTIVLSLLVLASLFPVIL
jgi:hypothetical protein